MRPTVTDVIAQIRAAFPTRPIAFADARGDGLDGNAYRDHVDGKTWLELDRAFVMRRVDSLSFLSVVHVVAVLRDQFESTIMGLVEDVVVNGGAAARLPGISNLGFPGVDSESLLMALPDIAMSTGSACNSAARLIVQRCGPDRTLGYSAASSGAIRRLSRENSS